MPGNLVYFAMGIVVTKCTPSWLSIHLNDPVAYLSSVYSVCKLRPGIVRLAGSVVSAPWSSSHNVFLIDHGRLNTRRYLSNDALDALDGQSIMFNNAMCTHCSTVQRGMAPQVGRLSSKTPSNC